MTEFLKHPGESGNDGLTPEAKLAAHSRRTFLFKLSVLLNTAVGTVLAVPLIGYLLGPAMSKNTGSWIAIGSVEEFPVGQTRLVDFESPVSRLGDGPAAKVACSCGKAISNSAGNPSAASSRAPPTACSAATCKPWLSVRWTACAGTVME